MNNGVDTRNSSVDEIAKRDLMLGRFGYLRRVAQPHAG